MESFALLLNKQTCESDQLTLPWNFVDVSYLNAFLFVDSP